MALVGITHDAGNLSEYTSTSGTGLSAVAGAGLNSTAAGLSVEITTTANRYAYKDFTAATSRYLRGRFYFDPNSPGTFTNGNVLSLVELQTSAASIRAQFRLYKTGGAFYARASVRDDVSALHETGDYAVTDAPHLFEFLITRATSNVAVDGTFAIWVDGDLKETITGIDIYDLAQPTRLCAGAVRSVTDTIRGTIYIDEIDLVDDAAFTGAFTSSGTATGVSTAAAARRVDYVRTGLATGISVASAAESLAQVRTGLATGVSTASATAAAGYVGAPWRTEILFSKFRQRQQLRK